MKRLHDVPTTRKNNKLWESFRDTPIIQSLPQISGTFSGTADFTAFGDINRTYYVNFGSPDGNHAVYPVRLTPERVGEFTFETTWNEE